MSELPVIELGYESIGVFTEKVIQPGQITEFRGRNGSGKSTLMNGALSLFRGGSDDGLLQIGAEKGSVYAKLRDGSEIIRRFRQGGKSTLTVKHPTMGAVSKPQTAVESLVELQSINPVLLLHLPEKKLTEYLFEVAPIDLSLEEIAEAVGDAMSIPAMSSGTPLETLDALRSTIYEMRTGVNAEAKKARTTADGFAQGLPDEDELGRDYVGESEDANRELRSVEGELQAACGRVNERFRNEVDQSGDEFRGRRSRVITEADAAIGTIDEQIRELQRKRAEAVERRAHDLGLLDQTEMAAKEQLRSDWADELAGLKEQAAPRIAELSERVAALQEGARHMAQHRNTAKQVAAMREDAVRLETRSAALSEAILRLDTLKREKLATLPITGVEVRNGLIYRDGVPFSNLNTAARLDIAFELSLLKLGELPLMFVDGAECLDSDSLAHLKQRSLERGVILFVSRVTDGDLEIVTEEVAA